MIAAILLAAAAPPTAAPQPLIPRERHGCRVSPSNRIIVQGGSPVAGGGTPSPAIGPKQDDPVSGGHGGVALGTSGGDPRTIGPKQDDPVSGGHGALAIGPKQDDPSPPPTASLTAGACPSG
jgi:hypothetical protein